MLFLEVHTFKNLCVICSQVFHFHTIIIRFSFFDYLILFLTVLNLTYCDGKSFVLQNVYVFELLLESTTLEKALVYFFIFLDFFEF